ncbi:MAG TPA: hypothetical protein GXX20_10655 [Clostridiaceae bacterium]|nr:hypothetical protein [Clostridiaceae bacterium]
MDKKWLLITIIAVVVVAIVAIPLGIVLSVHNSVYDTSFEYIEVEDLIAEIATKHVYYNAGDKTVEIEISQDMINSIIKDNLEGMDLGLPAKMSLQSVLFNTKDQRIYINAKYGNLNLPVSLKVNISSNDDGITIMADDMLLGRMKAPGFVKKQLPTELLTFEVKYDDFGVPKVFSVKDIKFGSGTVKAVIQLDVDKIVEMAMGYRSDLMSEINRFKNSQGDIVATFLSRVLDTGVLEEAKVREYVEGILNNEELVNSAIHFAFVKDYSKYTSKIGEAQEKVAQWIEPLTNIKIYDTIDETVEKILDDEKLTDFLKWFLTEDQIAEYKSTILEYYGMYKEYYGMYEDLLASIDDSVAKININQIDETVNSILTLATNIKDSRELLQDTLAQIDAEALSKLILYLEQDEGYGGEYIRSIDQDGYNAVRDYLVDAPGTKKEIEQFLADIDFKPVDEFTDALVSQKNTVVGVVNTLKRKDYEGALNKIASGGLVDSKAKNWVDTYTKELDVNAINELFQQ